MSPTVLSSTHACKLYTFTPIHITYCINLAVFHEKVTVWDDRGGWEGLSCPQDEVVKA